MISQWAVTNEGQAKRTVPVALSWSREEVMVGDVYECRMVRWNGRRAGVFEVTEPERVCSNQSSWSLIVARARARGWVGGEFWRGKGESAAGAGRRSTSHGDGANRHPRPSLQLPVQLSRTAIRQHPRTWAVYSSMPFCRNKALRRLSSAISGQISESWRCRSTDTLVSII